jgi:predicted PurR-regulated permease PerM
VYLLTIGSFLGFLYIFVPPVVAEAGDFVGALPQYLSPLTSMSPVAPLSQATDILGSQRDLQVLAESLLSLQSVFTSTTSGFTNLLIAFFGGLVSFFLVLVLSFYFALQDTGVDDFLRLVLPVEREEYAVSLWRRAQKKIGLWMQGQLLLSVIVGVLVYLGMLIIGVPYALLLAVFTAFAEIIPIFGALVAGLVAMAIAYSQGGVALAAIVAGLYIVVNQFEANLIYPLIVKKVIGIPPLLVIVALVAGSTLVGFLGVLLAVPISASALELLADYDKHKRRAHAHS